MSAARFHQLLRDYSLARARDSEGITRRTFATYARADHKAYMRAKRAGVSS